MAVAGFFMFASLHAQWNTTSQTTTNTQTMEEVRNGSTITYDLSADHNTDDAYRWAVIGGTITSTINGATISSSGDSSIVEFSANTYQITVQWDADLSTIPVGSFDGQILIQKKSATGSCPSQFQNLPVRQWNNATAEIDAGNADFEICSGDAVGGTITLNVTGAPDDGSGTLTGNGFDVVYDISATGLTDLGGTSLDATGLSATGNTASLTIDLPDGLINASSTADATFTITLQSMQDAFDDGGSIVNKTTFTITVHPTVTTGDIVSGSSLSRR